MTDPVKGALEVAISTTLVLGVALAMVRLMRPMMLDSMGGDTQENRERMRWLEKTTLKFVAGFALLGCAIVLTLSGP